MSVFKEGEWEDTVEHGMSRTSVVPSIGYPTPLTQGWIIMIETTKALPSIIELSRQYLKLRDKLIRYWEMFR